jgi:alkanesulfonate monooxygenase SsuD/methylene tetrahydromethanopterin reductase-like flavin-dependent oxidoreductase (luciferase family)
MTAFGLYAAIGDPPRGEHLQQRIDEVCAEAQLAEQVGFDAILVRVASEQRLATFGSMNLWIPLNWASILGVGGLAHQARQRCLN